MTEQNLFLTILLIIVFLGAIGVIRFLLRVIYEDIVRKLDEELARKKNKPYNEN